MSFKYRFILSFVFLEIFFILLIVSINFFTISNSSKKLTNEKITSNTIFLEQLVKVPVSIYDIATLDDLVENTMKYMNSIVILDSNDRVLSSNYLYNKLSLEELLKIKENKSIVFENETFEIIYKKLYSDDIYIGAIYLIFDTSNNTQFIETNKTRTMYIILLEILLSTLLSYIIGRSLTTKLSTLSEVAFKIGKNRETIVPFTNLKDEIGILSNSMNSMQENLSKRRKELKDYNKMLRKQRLELIDANKAKDDFLANMSHELKTPLNSINVISDLMMRNRSGNLDKKQVKNLEIVNKCGKDLLFLINDILDLSKLEAGQILLNNDNLDVKDFVISIYDMFSPQAKEKGITFLLEIDDSLDYIFSDESRVKQIIKNLLSNALKFTKNGTISLIIKDENENISFIVKDEGIGIPKEKLEYIFDRFKQADGTTTRKYGGTGLGLSICKELSVLLKGSIQVESNIDIGSSFILTLPKNKELAQGIKVLDIISEPEVKKEENIEKKSILIYNNDPVQFMSFSIKIAKYYELIQVKDLSTIKDNDEKIIMNINKLNEKEIDTIVNNNIKNIVALQEEKSLDKRVIEKIVLLVKKPFNNFDFSKI